LVPPLVSLVEASVSGDFKSNTDQSQSSGISGHIDMQWLSDSTVQFNYNLNTAGDCESGALEGTKNSCGLHFHSGTSCDAIGGHLYNKDTINEDPWTFGATYAGGEWTGEGMVKGSLVVTYGLSARNTAGKLLVMHNQAGDKISCTVLPENIDQDAPQTCVGASITSFTTYPTSDYTGRSDGPLYPTGSVEVWFGAPGQVTFAYDLENVDPACADGPSEAANSCGIHFHAGTSCDTHAQVLGHYWNTATLAEDPWKTVTYMPGQGSVTVNYGIGSVATEGHAFVLHDRDGKRISCDILADVDFKPYYVAMTLAPVPDDTATGGDDVDDPLKLAQSIDDAGSMALPSVLALMAVLVAQ
jgi:hypothetical protein